MKAATIYDVARHAGVSHMTVSRYLAGFEGIRPSTRERVEMALRELQYRQNTTARSLRLARSNRIGVLADRIDQHGPARVLSGATQVAHENGFLLDVVSVDGLDADSVQSAIDTLRTNQVAGILATAQTDVVRDLLRERVTDLPLLTEASVLVTSDDTSSNEYTGALAADHLLDLGHRVVAYISGPGAWIAARSRRDGFCDRVRERGGIVAWTAAGDWSAASGFAAWRAHSVGSQDVSAVAAANDSMAIGVIGAAARDGRRVPQDLSVIGTDDIPEARFLNPALSTVALDFEGEGATFIAELLRLLDDSAADAAPVSAPRLVARESTLPH